MYLQLIAVLAVLAISASAISLNPDTVKELDIPKYLGLWYQMAADQVVISSFEAGSFCCTALYGDNGDDTISVHNYASQDSPDGTSPYVIDGYAFQSDPENYPGKLKVKFESGGAPFPAPYWVLELGPVNANGLYDYAIVSDSASLYLFVLARDPKTYNAKYKDAVSATLDTLGFKGYTKPIDTYQETDCVYESASRLAVMKKARFDNSTLAASSTCDGNTKESACMSGVESGESCAWCSSAAAGNICMKESDAETLPSSVFECEYHSVLKTSSTCDGNTKESACMSANESGESCAWCNSAAAGSICMKGSDATTLPSSVFECEYQ